MKRTVQLLGKGRGIEPPFPPDAERWGISDLVFRRYNGQFDSWTRWFDIHPVQERILRLRAATWTWYQQQDRRRPIYLLHKDPSVPGSITYPRSWIQGVFTHEGEIETNFASSLDWMMALAIAERFERIELCWFRMLDPGEYQKQVPTAFYWIAQARARGIEVVIHGDSTLKGPQRVYGFEYLTTIT